MARKNLQINLALLSSLALVISIIAIYILFMKVKQLETIKREASLLPVGILQTSQGNLLGVSARDFVIGNSNAKVTLIEYSDFECPECQAMHPILMQIAKDYPDQIRLVSRVFPLPQNTNAEKEAEAAECAGAIGGSKLFWEYSDGIYANTKGTVGGTGFALGELLPLAGKLRLNAKLFSQCLDKGEMAIKVDSDKQSGEKAGVSQLPAIFVINKNKTVVVGGQQSFQVMKTIVDEALIL